MIRVFALELTPSDVPVLKKHLSPLLASEAGDQLLRAPSSIKQLQHILSRVMPLIITGDHGGKILRSPSGKPYFHPPSDVYFNVSHSGVYFVLAMSSGEIGVDIETLREAPIRVANRFFTPGERDYMLGGQDVNKRFFEIFTRKEAYAKLTGRGIFGGALGYDTLTPSDLNFKMIPLWPNVVCHVCTKLSCEPDVTLLNCRDITAMIY